MFIELSICGSDSQHLILDFHKENTVLQNKEMLRNIDDIYVSIFGIYIQFWRLVYICMIYPT